MHDVLKIMRRCTKNMFVKTLLHWVGAFNVSQFSTMPQFVGFCSSCRF